MPRGDAGRARLAITAVFFLNGAVFSSWYARLPAIQGALGLDEGELGIALLGAPAGLLAAQPLVGAVVARRGSRPALALTPLFMVAVILPALATDLATLLLAVVVVGAANGALDIAMNAQGLAVERAARRRLFASLHAAFSFGALAGAALAGLAAAAGLAPRGHLALAAAAGAVAALVAVPRLLPARADAAPAASRWPAPSPRLAALAAIAFCALLAEGAVFDWSAVFLAGEGGASAGLAAFGLAAFSATMGCGRLAADGLTTRFGAVAVGGAGAALAGAGLGAALATAQPAPALAGFAAMGLGLAAVFPLALRAAGASAGAPGLASISTLGYGGFLTGPPLIGLLADATSLRVSLGVVCALLAVTALLAPWLAEPAPRPAPAPEG